MNVIKETYAHPMPIVKIHQEVIIVLVDLVILGTDILVLVQPFFKKIKQS